MTYRCSLVLAAVVVACAGPAGQPEKTASFAVTPSASPTLPGRMPGTVVGLTVNGKTYPISQPVGATGDLRPWSS